MEYFHLKCRYCLQAATSLLYLEHFATVCSKEALIPISSWNSHFSEMGADIQVQTAQHSAGKMACQAKLFFWHRMSLSSPSDWVTCSVGAEEGRVWPRESRAGSAKGKIQRLCCGISPAQGGGHTWALAMNLLEFFNWISVRQIGFWEPPPKVC